MREITFLTIALAICALIIFVAFEKAVMVADRCLSQVEARYDYVSRKMCDPTKPELCSIEPSLQLELEVWKLEEMNKCE